MDLQTVQGKAGYGLVLALQLTVPCTRLTLVQSLSAEYPDHPRQMFRLEVSDIQTAVALEDSEQDIRSGDTCCCTIPWVYISCCAVLCCAVLCCVKLCCVKLCPDKNEHAVSSFLCVTFIVHVSLLAILWRQGCIARHLQ